MPPHGSTSRRSRKPTGTRSAAATPGRCSSSISAGNSRHPPHQTAGEQGAVNISREATMDSKSEIDVHEELAGAAVGPWHKGVGVLITLITLFDGYDTFHPA